MAVQSIRQAGDRPQTPSERISAGMRDRADMTQEILDRQVRDESAAARVSAQSSTDPTTLRATEVVALAQMVLTREFRGPVRTATAQELLHQAKVALGRGESSLAADLASLASRVMNPPIAGSGPGGALPPAGELMHEGGGAALDVSAGPGAGIRKLAAREPELDLAPPPAEARPLPIRLMTDGTPRGIPSAFL
ncbi:MAG: hypothetical protein FJZ00_12520 [Candidatus Sericytochromatia bacterium]|uniref:Uncharacterized protein n=1 Tax=Candidatus Tanganyikabacteria bacterium TaxID=2961651 RepID=A0A937X8B6_9BACT|nr:hypothetical protein [Candidatus Tanganyikabacteria bacterium]